MKRFFIMVLTLALALSLTACGGGDKPSAGGSSSGASDDAATSDAVTTPSTVKPADDGKKVGGYAPGERSEKLFGHTLCQLVNPVRMVLRMDIEMEEGKTETVDMTIAVKDGVVATDFTTATTGHVSSLARDGKNYTIIHDQKMIMEQEQPMEIPNIGANDAAYYEELTYTAGTEEIGGKTYEYDEMTEPSGDVTRVYFEPGTEHWTYMRTGDELIEVIDYGNDPDPAMLELPSGYSTMDMGAMSGGLPEGFQMP